MSLLDKRLFGFFFFLLSIFPTIVFAEVYINEIMYDLSGTDTGREWIEIYNSGPSSMTIVAGGTNAAWRFSEGSQHTLTLASGSLELAAGGYAVIADNAATFMVDWPSFSGTLFDSSFSLNNTGGTVSILSSKDGQVLGQATYASSQGANGDGNTLQRQEDGTFIVALPTPGQVNSTTPVTSQNNSASTTTNQTSTTTSTTSQSTNTSSHTSYASATYYTPPETLKINAGRNRLAPAGIPIEFEAEANIKDLDITYAWTFGDGTKEEGNTVSHEYLYPGTYVVVLNATSSKGPAVSRTEVSVIEAKLSIAEANKNYIKIKNDSKNEINLFGWILDTKEDRFEFPVDTIIQPGSTSTFPTSITGLKPENIASVALRMIKESSIEVQTDIKVGILEDVVTPNVDVTQLYTQALEIQDQLAKVSLIKNSPPKKEPVVQLSKTKPKEEPKKSIINQNTAAAVGTLNNISKSDQKISGSSLLSRIKNFFFGKNK